MSLTLIKETGAGLGNANAYADAADGDAYHDGHLYASAWTGAAVDQKAAALVMASRLIDAEYQFGGTRVRTSQALQWPRQDCRDPDADGWTVGTVSDTVVPKALVAATCEMARELLIVDRTAAPAGEGLKYYNDAGQQTGYDKSDTRPVISPVAQAMLAKYGALLKSKSGAVRLVRA